MSSTEKITYTPDPSTGEWERAGIDGDALREARRGLGLSQNEVAARIGSNAVTVSNWETGKHVPTAVYRGRLVEVLGLDMTPGEKTDE